ncbi:MAG: hypothetical protein ACK4TI_01200, partial [Nitrososphaerales archaeon]
NLSKSLLIPLTLSSVLTTYTSAGFITSAVLTSIFLIDITVKYAVAKAPTAPKADKVISLRLLIFNTKVVLQ